MRRKGSECGTRISPAEIGSATPMIPLASRSGRWAAPDRERPRQARGACGTRLLRSARWTAARFYRRARVSIVRAFRSASTTTRKTAAAAAAAAAAASVASPDCTPARHSSRRQQPAAAPPVVVDDSHKSEAVEECIRFMNSSSRKYR
ncbi:josephin-like protein [Panicum miliaceum]|uniref:Josephin-like protein n=1 Tax=Panicum miliaceum TaxID=4540 RepID=A0A3L6SIM5_PANMI|nr:josephin-like protein [Panicum miliaceum]